MGACSRSFVKRLGAWSRQNIVSLVDWRFKLRFWSITRSCGCKYWAELQKQRGFADFIHIRGSLANIGAMWAVYVQFRGHTGQTNQRKSVRAYWRMFVQSLHLITWRQDAVETKAGRKLVVIFEMTSSFVFLSSGRFFNWTELFLIIITDLSVPHLGHAQAAQLFRALYEYVVRIYRRLRKSNTQQNLLQRSVWLTL